MATRIEFHKHGGPDVLKAVEFTPAAPGENEIQVENKAIGINYIDTYIRGGLYPPPSMPSGLGTEAFSVSSAKWAARLSTLRKAIAWCTRSRRWALTAPSITFR